MGQYYKPIILAENKKTIVKWMYSHEYGNGLKLMEHSWMKNNFVRAFETLLLNNPQRVVWAGDYAEPEKGLKNNAYSRCIDKTCVKPPVPSKQVGRYVVNHTKKTFVDKSKVIDVDGYKIHPLPLLTCEGNGQGGGDFFGNEKGKVGIWARDIISIETKKPKGFKELIFDLTEHEPEPPKQVDEAKEKAEKLTGEKITLFK